MRIVWVKILERGDRNQAEKNVNACHSCKNMQFGLSLDPLSVL